VTHHLISLLNSWYTVKRRNYNVKDIEKVRYDGKGASEISIERRDYIVKDINIVRYDGKGASEIYMKTAKGLNVLHTRRDFRILSLAGLLTCFEALPIFLMIWPKLSYA